MPFKRKWSNEHGRPTSPMFSSDSGVFRSVESRLMQNQNVNVNV